MRNLALGYLVKVDLKAFHWSMRNDMGVIRAFTFYEEMKSENEEQLAEWKKNRRACYFGSIRHFLKSIAKGKVFENNFVVSYTRRSKTEWDRIRKFNSPDIVNGLIENHVQTVAPGFHRFESERIIEITYKGDEDTEYYDYLKKKKITIENEEGYQISRIKFVNGPLFFNDNGYFKDQTNTLVVGGYLAWKRFADKLPLDYDPEE